MTAPVAGILLRDAAAWRIWLEEHHEAAREAWVVLAKKGTVSPTTLRYDEAVEEAACFGWVDGLVRGRDSTTYLQRFSPRLAKGNWTAGNVALVQGLTAQGRMHRSGLAAVERARASGRFPG